MAGTDRFGLAVGPAMRRVVALVCVALRWSGAGAAAQDNGVPTLHVYPNLVQIPTLVVTQGHEPVTGIAESRFFVSLDGGPKFRVTHVRLEGDDPISLAIVLDVSQPFPRLMERMDDAIAGLAPAWLHATDQVSVYSMDCKLARSGLVVPADSATLKREVDQALEPWRKHGRQRWTSACKQPTNLWDSLTIVTQALAQRLGWRVVLVVTDGVDRGSKTSWNKLREYAQERAVATFGLIQTGDATPRGGGRGILRTSSIQYVI